MTPTIKFDRPEAVIGQKVAIVIEGLVDDDREKINVKIYDNDSVFYDDSRKGHRQHFAIKEVELEKKEDVYVNSNIDTSGLSPGNHTAVLEYNNEHYSDRIRIISPQQGKTDVTLQRTASFPTDDQALWATIRSSTNAISFDRYQQFVSLVFNENAYHHQNNQQHRQLPHYAQNLSWMSNLNIYGPYSYTVLKLATQAFLTLQCGLKPIGNEIANKFFHGNPPEKMSGFFKEQADDRDEEARRSFIVDGLTKQLSSYLGENKTLPYLDRIVNALLSIPGDPDYTPSTSEVLPYYYGILQQRASNPSLIELIWSYWHEEGMLAQTMNAIALRFQNQRSGPNDPLAELEIDPLRPLNNMIWGFVQDRYNQLSVSRRAAEYGHQYGLRLLGRAVPELQIADNRSKFIEAFHNLLYRTAVFYREDADTTVVSNAFPLLNALKDVHLLLAEGAHNQYGDLPWTARAEMLTQQWMLARPEMREFLRGRHMVPYQETWMGAVDAMKKLQGWSDTTISHFHELAVDG